jgi:hypothetical protein
MTMERRGGDIVPVCDICGEELPAEADFRDALEAKRKAGWKTDRLPSGEYEDVCPACQNGGSDPEY